MHNTYRNFNSDQLESFFQLIADPDDWRKPVDAIIHSRNYSGCSAACQYFTATPLEIAGELEGGRLRVTAAGYRNGPVGP